MSLLSAVVPFKKPKLSCHSKICSERFRMCCNFGCFFYFVCLIFKQLYLWNHCAFTVLIITAASFLIQDQLELSMREKSGLHETERQLQLKIKTLQSCLKTEKDEVSLFPFLILQKNCWLLQSIPMSQVDCLASGAEAPEYYCQQGHSVQPWRQEKRERSC